MKLFICFLSLLSFSISEGFDKEIDLNNKLKNTDLNTKKVDSREGIQEIDFKKLFSDAENYFNSAKAWKKLKCSPKSGFICTKHECKKRDIIIWRIEHYIVCKKLHMFLVIHSYILVV